MAAPAFANRERYAAYYAANRERIAKYQAAYRAAKRSTEKVAALLLGLEPRTWYRWRERHANQEEFDALLARTRSEYIRANLREVEKAAAGKDSFRHD